MFIFKGLIITQKVIKKGNKSIILTTGGIFMTDSFLITEFTVKMSPVNAINLSS